MKTSNEGLRLITQREGKILHVYKDSKGLPTAGVGHLLTASERAQFPVGTPITPTQCTNWLRQDLGKCEQAVNGLGVSLSQNEFDALVSLSFNIGVGGFNRSTVAKRLKQGDHHAAANAILLWNKPPEIRGRRRGEYHQFLTPYPAAIASVPDVASVREDVETTATDPQLPADSTPADLAAGPSTTQNAEQIINTGDQAPPAPNPQDITMSAPQGMGSVSSSNKVMIGSIVVPTFLVTIFKAIGNLISQGYIDAKDVGNTVINLIQNNFKYILGLAGLVVLVIVIKKIAREVIFLASVISHAIPGWNNVTVVAPETPAVTKKWWQF